MYIPFTMEIQGRETIDMLLCARSTVRDWRAPVLRNTYWRCYVLLDGRAAVRSAGAEWPLREGDVMLIPPDSRLTGHADGPFTLYFAHFNSTLRAAEALPCSQPLDPALPVQLEQAWQAGAALTVRLLMLQVITSSLARLPEGMLVDESVDPRVRRAYQVMKEHLEGPLGNAELAAALHLSTPSLLRLFRTRVGASPYQEHLRLRLNRAADLLRGTSRSIEDIAAACGFTDRHHLTRVFTREWKTPPARYRRQATPL